MSETSSPVLPDTSWAQCTCPRCERRRASLSLASGCPCDECQPGEGIDFAKHLSARSHKTRKRMKILLEKNDRGTLTPDEEIELDHVCHDYLFGN